MKKVLKASAGTGKTYRLSLEYVISLLKGQKFEEIVVMTFTRKATAEIRERIINHIEDILKYEEKSDVFESLQEIEPGIILNKELLEYNYHMMLKNKDGIHIYTIDSFINRIFKQAIAPYLDIYSYQIIEEEENNSIYERLFKKILDNPHDFELMEGFLTDNRERKIENYIELIKKMIIDRWKFLLIDFQERKKKNCEKLVYLLDQSLDYLIEIAQKKGKEFNESFLIKPFSLFIEEYINLNNEDQKRQKIIKNCSLLIKKTFWHGNKVRGKNCASLKENMEACYQQFREQLAAYVYNQEMIPYEKEIYNFSGRIFALYDDLKFNEKSFTHSDISNYTYKYLYETNLDLIKDNQVTAYFYELIGTKIKTLLIDEFQDTSILQWKILKPLLEDCQNVITVGDEKQSIYGWRGGEKQLFSDLDKILKAKRESLLTCYRSHKEILKFLNKFFLNLDIDWEYEAVDYLSEKDKGYVEVIVGGEKALINTETKTFKRKSPQKQEEIKKLNNKIKGDLKEEISKRIKQLPNYNNTAILARSNDQLTAIATELDKQGISYILESKDSLIDHRAVSPLYFLLYYINYRDYFYLLKFLRSDLINISNSSLKYLLKNKKEVEKFMFADGKITKEKLIPVLREIKRLQKMEYEQLTEYVIKSTGIIELYSDNRGALKNIYRFHEILKKFSCLHQLINYIEEHRESEQLKQQGIKEEGAVQLMTIHKAKGLSFTSEFFYWSPGSSGGNFGEKMEFYITFDNNFQEVDNFLLTSSDYEKLFKYLDFDFIERKKEKELMEEINNVYVAMTRPVKNLFLYIKTPRQLDPFSDLCWDNGSGYQFYENALLQAVGKNSLCDLVQKKQMGELIIEKSQPEEEDINLPEMATYFASDKISAKKMTEINKEKDFDMDLKKEINRIGGLAVHFYLEHIKYGSKQEKKYAAKILKAHYGNILGLQNTENIISRVNNFIYNNQKYFSRRWQVFLEYELKYKDRFYRIDRLLVDQKRKEILILDYKSGISREQEQLDQYIKIIRSQLKEDYSIKAKFIEV